MRGLKSKFILFWQPSPAKNVLIVATASVWLILGALFLLHGYNPTWRLWGVPTVSPFFVDFRLLPAMVQSLHAGLDPAVHNPSDPKGRVFNYPSVWYLLAYTGLSQSDTLYAGILLLCLFFFGFLLFPGSIRNTTVVMLLLVGFSPAAMMLYERANVDLLFFFLCALAIAIAEFSTIVAALSLGVAAIFKFFPILGFAMFMSKEKRTFFILLTAAAVVFGAYIAVVSRDLNRAWDLTNRGKDYSYGVQVAAMHFPAQIKRGLKLLGVQPKAIPSVAKAISYGLAGLIVLFCVWFGLRRREGWTSSSQRNLKAFWVGAAIYVGTFLLGNNWDYRLAFLLFAVPQLSEWMSDRDRARSTFAWITAGLLVLSCWYLFYRHYAPSSLKDAAFLLDEAVNWSLYGTLSYVLAASVPDPIRSIFSRRRTPSAPAIQPT